MDQNFHRWMQKIPPGGEITVRGGIVVVNSGKRDAYLIIKTPRNGISKEPQHDKPDSE